MASDNKSKAKSFDLQRLVELISTCQDDKGEVKLDIYLDAFVELNKMFGLLGTIFGFIVSDVKEKIGILRHYMTSPNAVHYATAQSLVNFEVTSNITIVKGKPPSGARSLLRLHRALEFIIRFLHEIKNAEGTQKLGGIAGTAYSETLSKHHIWIVRKTVGLALHTLPTRNNLLEKMGEDSIEKTTDLLGEAVQQAQPLYDTVQQIYATNNILDLP